jgi:hypothetical protein
LRDFQFENIEITLVKKLREINPYYGIISEYDKGRLNLALLAKKVKIVSESLGLGGCLVKGESLAAIESRTFSSSQPFQTLLCVSHQFDFYYSSLFLLSASLKLEK